jgi:hypothetical protein
MLHPEAPHVDLDLEEQIDFQHRVLSNAVTPDEKRTAWERLKQLVGMRSPEHVEQMEIWRGLR